MRLGLSLDKTPWSSIVFSGIETALFVAHVAAPTHIGSTELLWGQLIALPALLPLIKDLRLGLSGIFNLSITTRDAGQILTKTAVALEKHVDETTIIDAQFSTALSKPPAAVPRANGVTSEILAIEAGGLANTTSRIVPSVEDQEVDEITRLLVGDSDTRTKLVLLRAMVEDRVLEATKSRYPDPRKAEEPQNLHRLIVSLRTFGVPSDVINGLERIVKLGDLAAHGATIEDGVEPFIKEYAQPLLAALDILTLGGREFEAYIADFAIRAGHVVDFEVSSNFHSRPTRADFVVDNKVIVEVKSNRFAGSKLVDAALGIMLRYKRAFPNHEQVVVFGLLDGKRGYELAEVLDQIDTGIAWFEGGTYVGSDTAKRLIPWLFDASKVRIARQHP